MTLFHHCMGLEHVVYDSITGSVDYSKELSFIPSYLWLEAQVGFYPLFLSVGESLHDIRMTGYHNQWMRYLGEDESGKVYRQKGNFPNDVLFSFSDLDGVFMDYAMWELFLHFNDERLHPHYEHPVTRETLFHPKWSKQRWLEYARDNPGRVQFVAGSLDLTTASRVWVRNKPTKVKLEEAGFERVEKRRVKVLS